MDWTPTLADREGPVYRRIVEALSADIASGCLHRGQQLPTHRALAKALGIDLTTVTRAYAEAQQRGLTDARVGRGTFVAESLSHGLAEKPEIVALNKADALTAEELGEQTARLKRAAKKTPFVVSAATGAGVPEVVRALRQAIDGARHEPRLTPPLHAWQP